MALVSKRFWLEIMGSHGCIIHRTVHVDCNGKVVKARSKGQAERQIRVIKHFTDQGYPDPKRPDWQLPKGVRNKADANNLATAKRQTREEAGIHLTLNGTDRRVQGYHADGQRCEKSSAQWFLIEFDQAYDFEDYPTEWWKHDAQWMSVQQAARVLRRDHARVLKYLNFDAHDGEKADEQAPRGSIAKRWSKNELRLKSVPRLKSAPRLKSVPRSCHGYSKSVKDPHDQAKSFKEVKKEYHDLPEQCEDLKSFLSQALCDAWSSGATEQAQNHDERKDSCDDMVYGKIEEWRYQRRGNTSLYTNETLEQHEKMFNIMMYTKDGAEKENTFFQWCRRIDTLREQVHSAATEQAASSTVTETHKARCFKALAHDLLSTELSPAQKKEKAYRINFDKKTGDIIVPSKQRSWIHSMLRRNLGDAKVSYFMKSKSCATLRGSLARKSCVNLQTIANYAACSRSEHHI